MAYFKMPQFEVSYKSVWICLLFIGCVFTLLALLSGMYLDAAVTGITSMVALVLLCRGEGENSFKLVYMGIALTLLLIAGALGIYSEFYLG